MTWKRTSSGRVSIGARWSVLIVDGIMKIKCPVYEIVDQIRIKGKEDSVNIMILLNVFLQNEYQFECYYFSYFIGMSLRKQQCCCRCWLCVYDGTFRNQKKKSFYVRVRIRQSLPVWDQPRPEESPGKHLTYWTHLFIESYKAVKTAFWKCLGLYTWQSAAYYGLFTNTAIICHYVFMPNSVRCQTLI